jgi:hypothetical protein
MRDDDWSSLTSAIENGTCNLMLGPDAFVAEFDGELLPVAVGMARWVVREKLRDRLGPDEADLDPSNPWAVAQVAAAKEDAYTVRGWAREFYETHNTVSQALHDLASLPFELVVNTSPGLAAELAFRAVKPSTYSDFYDRKAPARTLMPDPSRQAPVVYNLFGSLQNKDSMLLSELDRFEFLIAVIKENPPLPEKLLSRLRDRNQSFLFLGFDLAQWQLRMLVHVLANNVQREYKSFALELEGGDIDGEARLFYMRGHRLQFVDMDLTTFAAELVSRVGGVAAGPTPSTNGHGPAPAADAPSVFVCHAHEDAAEAERVSAGLRANRFDVWLDKDALEGGDDWDAAIEQRILRETDYVVVLQSANLLRKEVGYVNKEINLAFDRQQEYRPPRRFIIPTVVDDPANQLVELSNWQFVDLRRPDGIDEIVKAIRGDLDRATRFG